MAKSIRNRQKGQKFVDPNLISDIERQKEKTDKDWKTEDNRHGRGICILTLPCRDFTHYKANNVRGRKTELLLKSAFCAFWPDLLSRLK
jgi:hypothetical protein